jgi:hypothetical protein
VVAVTLRSPLLLVPLLLAASPEQTPPLRDLPRPVRELEEPFSQIAAVMELQSGKVLVIDQIEGTLNQVDFATGARAQIGRQGSGPGEFRTPTGLARLAGDTIWVFDATQQRVVVLNPNLTPGTTFPFLTLDAGASTMLTAPMLVDLRGRLFASSIKVQLGGNNMSLPDSATIVQLDPRAGGKPTELARVRLPLSGSPRIQQDPGGRSMKITTTYGGLVSADAWVVFRDGRVAIVHGDTYTVEFVSADGQRTPGVAIPHQRTPVTDADKVAEMEEARRLMSTQNKMATRMMPAGVSVDFEVLPPSTWPSHYPPVAPLGAIAAPDGRLWVKRAVPIRLAREQWDVIDPSGRLVARWQLPQKTSLVGVGPTGVYTARTDADDLRYLQRVELPR